MALGWKVLMPIGLAYVMLIATAVYLTENVLGLTSPLPKMLVLTAINLVLGYIVFFVIDRGLLISGSRNRPVPGGLDRAA
jgi:hypothetical protein